MAFVPPSGPQFVYCSPNGDNPNFIDLIVCLPGWQQTIAGEREVQKALGKTLLKYRLHHDQDLFDRAYGYIKQYY